MSQCDAAAFDVPRQPSAGKSHTDAASIDLPHRPSVMSTVSHPWVPPIRTASSAEALEKLTWAEKLEHFLHSYAVHWTVIILLVIDMTLVLTSGVLESHYLTTQIEDYEAFVEACTPSSSASPASGGRLLRDAGVHQAMWRVSWRRARRLGGGSVDCAHPHFGNHSLHDAEKVLAMCSVAILFVFLLENILLVICIGREFFHNLFMVLDISVVSVSIALEILTVVGVFEYTSFVGLLILARVWRFARVGHGVYAAGERRKHTCHEEDDEGDTTEAGAPNKASQVAPE